MVVNRRGKANMSISAWEASMWSAVRTAAREDRFDLLNLYLKLEKASKKYIATGEMEEGSSFRVPLETGTFLKVSFYKNCSTIDVEMPDGRTEVAVSKADSFQREYRYLEAMSAALCPDSREKSAQDALGIGAKAPAEFCNALASAVVGDVFVFDNGRAFVCEESVGSFRTFAKTSGSSKTPHVSEMGASERFTVNTEYPASVQRAYRLVKDSYSCDVKMKVTTVTAARQILNSLFADAESTKVVTLGPNRIVAQKSATEKGMVYFNETGDRLSERQVLLTLAWLEANPNKIEISRCAPPSPAQKFDDSMLVRTVDELMARKMYQDAVGVVKGYVLLNGGVLEVDMRSFVKDEEGYEAVSYLFKRENDGELSITEVRYEGNDFSKEIASVRRVGEESVVAYCSRKYDEKFSHIKSMVVENALEQFPKWKGEFFEKVTSELSRTKMMTERAFGVEISEASGRLAALASAPFEPEQEEYEND